MKLFLLLAILASPAHAAFDCNGDWIDVDKPKPPNPPCRVLAPEMDGWLLLPFCLAAGSIVVWNRRKL